MNLPGTRAVPSLRYTLDYTPKWSHVRASSLAEQLTEADDAPEGGFDWDGRFDTLHAQAMSPLFAPNEMANKSSRDLAGRIARTHYASEFGALFGENIFNHPALAVSKAALAIESFELEDTSFHPYSSKFDAWMDGKAKLNTQELRGKQLFDDPASGNCASCHLDQRGANGTHPLFTDYQFEALGVPRNYEIPVNANPNYYDLGLCGPLRRDEGSRNRSYCGLFKTPTLRNVTIRRAFFHNGMFHSLRAVIRFYVQRDTNPARWYPRDRHHGIVKFDDIPPTYRGNVDTTDVPLDLHPGDKPVWNERDIDDVIAFLETLEDSDVATKREVDSRKLPVSTLRLVGLSK